MDLWTYNDEGFDEYVVDHDEYLGVGSGAFSFLGDSLYVNTFSLRRYAERIAAGNTGVRTTAVRSTNIQFCSIDSFSDYSLTAFRASTSVKFTGSISTVRS